MASPLTYNPSIDGIVLARPVGALYWSVDGRSTYPDTDRYVRRPFQSLAFVKSYFNVEEFRRGMFSIYVNETGTLNESTGYFDGGVTKEYWWKEEDLSDDGLVEKTSDLSPYATLVQLNNKVEQEGFAITEDVTELINYSGLATKIYLKEERKQGYFFYSDAIPTEMQITNDEEEIVPDDAMVFYASGKGSGYWIRFVEDKPLRRYGDYENINHQMMSRVDGSVIRASDAQTIFARLASGKGTSIVLWGSSGITGSLQFSFSSGVYGEATGTVNASGSMMLALEMLLNDPNFIKPNKDIYPVVEPYNANGIVSASGSDARIRLYIPYHYLTTTANPTVTYTIRQKGAIKKSRLTVYFFKRTSDQSASFDIVTSLGITTVSTYVDPLTYSSTSGENVVSLRIEKITVDIPATTDNQVSIQNIVERSGAGYVCIAGFALGEGVTIKHLGVSSASLKESSYNTTRGITTNERFELGLSYNPDFVIIQFIDSRSQLDSPPAEFAENLRYRVKQIRNQNRDCAILLVTNQEALEGEPTGRENIPWYNNAMQQVAIQENCSFFDQEKVIRELPVGSYQNSDFYADYIHMTWLGNISAANALCAMYGLKPQLTNEGLPAGGGALPTFKDYGLGTLNRVLLPVNDPVNPSLTTLNSILIPSGFYAVGATTVGSAFPGSDGQVQIFRGAETNTFSQVQFLGSGVAEPRMAIRHYRNSVSTWTVWREIKFITDIPTVVSTSIPSLTTPGYYEFTHSGARTWVLPVVSGYTGYTYHIKNRGTAILTITSNDGTSTDLFTGKAVSSIILYPGDSCSINNDGTYYSVLHKTKLVIIDTTTVAYTKATINSAYPNLIKGDIVVQDGAGQTYLKKDNSSTGEWSVFPTVQLT